ncbi:hypothetical protein AB0A76_22485 [Streptomyces exfoliatus]|uniref:Uncharacterized protein n=1 Tax=Streptomyces exfoliatus TaxID=1905 RepID=A0ABV3D0F1_STREX
MVGITGSDSGLDEAVERERAGAAGALREFLDSLDTAGRREAALALHRRVCRRSDEELARPAPAVLARQELGWSVAESDLLLARLPGRAAEAVRWLGVWRGRCGTGRWRRGSPGRWRTSPSGPGRRRRHWRGPRPCPESSAVCPEGRSRGVWCVRSQGAGMPS